MLASDCILDIPIVICFFIAFACAYPRCPNLHCWCCSATSCYASLLSKLLHNIPANCYITYQLAFCRGLAWASSVARPYPRVDRCCLCHCAQGCWSKKADSDDGSITSCTPYSSTTTADASVLIILLIKKLHSDKAILAGWQAKPSNALCTPPVFVFFLGPSLLSVFTSLYCCTLTFLCHAMCYSVGETILIRSTKLVQMVACYSMHWCASVEPHLEGNLTLKARHKAVCRCIQLPQPVLSHVLILSTWHHLSGTLSRVKIVRNLYM